MEIKTSQSYQKEVLEKYKREKGGDLRGYLAAPTRSQIRDACIYLFHRRNEKNDKYILNRFFQFKNDENKLREIENFGEGRFRSIEKFLKGEIKSTSTKNINLISWLIDFKPRPYEEYLKSESSVLEEEPLNKSNSLIKSQTESEKTKRNNELEHKKEEESSKKSEEKKRFRRIITIFISIAFGITLMIIGIRKWHSDEKTNNQGGDRCMTWVDSLYITISCAESPLSQYGTRVKPLDPMELKNMKKVEVNAAYPFFTEDGKPLIWYYKNKDNAYEYFTAPGYHPVNGETLKKITPYIIQTYVPMHINKKSSFVQ